MVGMMMFTFVVMAQSVEDAGAKYNEGNEFYKEKNYESAVTSYESALNIATKAGVDAEDLKANIEKQLMNAYLKYGLTQYKGHKFDAAIATLDKLYQLAEKLGNTSKQKQANSYIARVHTSKGGALLKNNKPQEAFAEYEMALELLPKYVKAYYGEGLVYKSQDDFTNMMIKMDKVIEYGANNPKAAKTVKRAKSTTAKTLVNAGAKEIQREHGKKAAEYINMSFKYASGNANAYYYLSIANVKTKSWDEAVVAANKAISLETGDKGDLYFTLGQAYEGKGDTSNACEAYKNVTSGSNVEAAKYQITQVLKCK